MLDQSRFEVMRQDLHRAAATIQKLKKERDDYRYSYEMLKENSISKRDLLRNQSFVDSLKDANELLQTEIINLRKQIDLRNRTVASLEEKLLSVKHTFKSQLQGLKDIETARRELNYEIVNTKFKGDKTPLCTQLADLTSTLLSSIKSNPSIQKIFKETVQCNKKFLSLIQNENYCVAFQLLSTFLIDLISAFRIDPENQSCSSDEDWKEVKKYKDELKESNEKHSMKFQGLQKKLKEVLDEHRIENEGLKAMTHRKRLSCDFVSDLGKGEFSERRAGESRVKRSEGPSLYIESPAPEKVYESQSAYTVQNKIRRVSTSKSPIGNSPRGRFEEFKVPFRKIQGSTSVAECLGNKNKIKK